MFQVVLLTEYLYLSSLDLLEYVVMLMTLILAINAYLLNFSKRVKNFFSKFYRRHNDLVLKFNVGLKSLLHQSLSEPEFYCDLVYKFKKIG